MRYRVITTHGEGNSVFSVVDSAAPEAEQPAVIASFIEGWLAIAFEESGVLNNDAINFLNSLIGAALALLWWALR